MDRRTALLVTDAAGRSQPLIGYGYDVDNELTTVTAAGGQPNQFCFDPLGRLCQQSLANGVTTTWNFDAAGFLSSLVTQKGATFLAAEESIH